MGSAIVLFSGGLDSMLAVRVLQRQGIEVTAFNIRTPFHDCVEHSRAQAEHLGVPLVVHEMGDEYLELIRNSKFGYGKAVNPCIDCRIAMCIRAKEYMEATGADFVATGEIVGQRPNSQKMHQLTLISRESGLGGKLVRPLSARVLEPSIPETEDILDREKLHSYTGRGRQRLIRLGRTYEIGKPPQPSTGCLLCEKSFAPRVIDLLKYGGDLRAWDAAALNAGRQLRIDETTKCVIARNVEHCQKIENLFARADARPSILYIPDNFNGPSVVLIGPDREKLTAEEFARYLALGGSLVLRFSNPAKYDPENALVKVFYNDGKGGESDMTAVEKIKAEKSDPVESYKIL